MIMGNPQQAERSLSPHALGRDVAVMLFLFLAGFTFLSLHTSAAGMAGVYLSRVLTWFLGYAADTVGVILVFGAVFAAKGGAVPRAKLKLLGAATAVCTLLIGVHLVTAPFYGVSTSAIKDWWYLGQTPGTGVAGAFLTYWSLKLLGEAGVRLLLVFLAVVSVVFLFDISIVRLVGIGVGKVKPKSRTASPQGQEHSQPKARTRPKRRRRSASPSGEEALQTVSAAGEGTADLNTERGVQSGSTAGEGRRGVGNKTDPPAKDKGRAEKEQQPQPTEVKTAATKVIQFPRRSSDDSGNMPGPDLFHDPGRRKNAPAVNQSALLEDTLASFGVDARVVTVATGPVITRYEVQPGPGIKVSKITNLADDLALALAAESVRIEAPVPGKPVVGIEVPNRQKHTVYIKEVLESPEFRNHPSKLAMALGKDISGKPVVADLKKILHLLIAGATGAGKSICLNTIIASLLFRADPNEVKLMMIDPKRVELVNYNGIPHLVSPVVTDPKKAATALRWAVAEMERRYQLFSDHGVRNVDGYNDLVDAQAEGEAALEHLPYIVVIVDELADLMLVAAGDVEDAICRLAQMARAAGMFLIIATQRPSVDVITGLIKANIPSRIAFAVSSQVDSRTILDMSGAERLLGKGDMLFMPIGASKAVRAQGAWILDQDVARLVDFWKQQSFEGPEIDIVEQAAAAGEETEADDELFEDAVQLVIDTGQASVSMLQRRFRIGYSRAARLIDIMELKGIVGQHQGSKPRDVLVDSWPSDDGSAETGSKTQDQQNQGDDNKTRTESSGG